jgi:CDP-6-deoxy-D-xylo-4-hexulose-3-dehydrase
MSDTSHDLPTLRGEILRLVREYSRQAHAANRPGDDPSKAPFRPDAPNVPYAGRVFTEDEVEAAVASTLDFWLTLGPEGEAFEKELAAWLGVRHSVLVNSGSSANLVAFAALTSPKIPADRRLEPGDEVITCAAGFPTTVAPIMQHGCVPVFIDNDPVTGNARVEQLDDAYKPGKTKAVMMAHALGNPFDLRSVLDFCRRHDLWLIEDNCDALGSTYTMPTADGPVTKPTGVWGDLSTQSFYPPHHLTLGEGGAVNVVSKAPLRVIVESFRDWGRDCWCPSGKDNTCNKRFGWQLGALPEGYDHKYIYSHLGYNLKPLDPQAAIGRAQLKKLPAFVEARRRNWQKLRFGLDDLQDVFKFSLPTHATGWSAGEFVWNSSGCRTDPSWFGFMLLVRKSAPFTRTDVARHLDARGISNRMLFGGNLVRQPVFHELAGRRPGAFRCVGSLAGADEIMNQALFVGVYPGLSDAQIAHVCEVLQSFARAPKAA